MARSRDFEQEANALSGLIQSAATWASPNYATIAELAMCLCRAGSAGVTLQDPRGDGQQVYWRAVTGDVNLVVGDSAAASCVPCGLAMATQQPLLVADPAATFAGFKELQPPVVEVLCVPFLVADESVGAIWAMSHGDGTRFDQGDARILQTLGAFTATIIVKEQAREARVLAEANQHRLDALLENIPEGIAIAEGSEALITHVSRYGQELTGRPIDMISGIPGTQVSEQWQVYFPDGGMVPTERLPLIRACRAGEIVRNEEVILRRPDGTETTVLCNAGPIRRKDGSISGGLAAWRDVDELKRARAALQSSEGMFRTLAESLPAKLFVTDLDGINTYVNRRLYEFTGAAPGSLLGSGWVTYVHPDDVPRVEAAWQKAVASSDSYEVEYRFLGVDGHYRWFLVRSRRFNGADGIPVGWCGAAIDIDEVRRAQDALRAASESKDTFLAMLAHELRNPLAPIRNSAQVLQAHSANAGTVAKCSSVIARQVATMARLLDDLLDISRITRGKLELRREPVQLWGVLGQAVETSRPLIEAHGHELIVRLPEYPVQMTVDPVRLTQVISNLLNNAAKFTPAGGRIELSGGIDHEGIFVCVVDNGVGLEPDAQNRIFSMFAQAGVASAGVQSGLGVGLALAKALVELHGGRIEVKSGGIGKGSEFWVRLPVTTRDVRPAPQPPQEAEKRSWRILLVDDNPDIVESMVMLLGIEGHDVRGAVTGLEALTVARDFLPEAMLLDIGMPGMDGYELARRLRQERGLERTKLIAVTGWGTSADKEKALAAGFDLHLTKPVDPDQLLQVFGAASPMAELDAGLRDYRAST